MTKTAFLTELERELASLPAMDRERSLRYFDEMIADRVEEGLTEEEAVAGLGSVKEIAAEILSEGGGEGDTPPPKEEKTFHGCPLWLAILLAALALPVWLPVVLSLAVTVFCLYLIPWCILLALFCTAVGCALGGVAGAVLAFVVLPVSGVSNAMLLLGMSLFCCGFGILLMFPVIYGTVWLAKGTAWCFRKLGSVRKEKKA